MVGFGELERIAEKAIVAYFKVLCQHLPEITTEDKRLVGKDLKRYPPIERKVRVLFQVRAALAGVTLTLEMTSCSVVEFY
jgi:hypothetical protein